MSQQEWYFLQLRSRRCSSVHKEGPGADPDTARHQQQTPASRQGTELVNIFVKWVKPGLFLFIFVIFHIPKTYK